jgi:hypothetical protein
MTFRDFQLSVQVQGEPPVGTSEPLQALWHDARGDWDRAHKIAQDVANQDGSWVHAYLHRKEGDIGNARYWYSRASRPQFEGTLEAEWEKITRELLRDPGSEGF